MKTSNSNKDGAAATPLSFTPSNVDSGSVAAVVAYISEPESRRAADHAAALLYPIVADQTRRQCRCSDLLFPADLNDLTQVAMIRLFNKSYLIGNQLLRESINRSDEGDRVASYMRRAVAAAVRISMREFLRDPFVQARKSVANDRADAEEISELRDERATGDESLQLRKLCPEYIPSASDEEKEIVQMRAEGLTIGEIAAVLEVKAERIKTVLKSIRRRLRRTRPCEAAKSSDVLRATRRESRRRQHIVEL